jgi:aquaporin Z
MSQKLIAELIGTFALIFIGAGTGAIGAGGVVGIAFAHGLVVLAFAYAYGHISGTHQSGRNHWAVGRQAD